MTSWRDVIMVHPAAELFPLMGSDELRELGEDIKVSRMKMPITLLHQQDGFSLLDGRNRLDALEAVGFNVLALYNACLEGKPRPELCVQYVAEPGVNSGLTDRTADPYGYVISANIRRRHLTAAQKSDPIAALLKANPERSDRAIAEIAKVDHEKVGSARKQLEATGGLPPVGKRIGRDGKARKLATQPANPHRATVTDAEFEDSEPPLPFNDPAPTPGYALGQTGAETISEAPMTVGSIDAAPTAAAPDETGESALPDETGAPPQLTTGAPSSAALATGSEPATLLLDRPMTHVPPRPTPPLPVPSTGEIPQSTGDALLSAALGDDPQHAERAEPSLEVVKRLVRELPVGELEVFKQWFREYAGAAIVSQSATPAKRGRGRPKGSTIANGARSPTVNPKEGAPTEARATAPEGKQMSLTGLTADDQPAPH